MAKKKANKTVNKPVAAQVKVAPVVAEDKKVEEKKVVAPVVEAAPVEKKEAPVKKAAPAKKAPAKKAAAKKPAAKKDNKVAVEFNIEVVDASVDTIYVCGSAKEIGAWNVAKAVEIKKNADGKFVASVKFNANDVVEFKVLRAKDWAKVEKGMQCEEINNHSVLVAKDAVAALVVYNWAE